MKKRRNCENRAAIRYASPWLGQMASENEFQRQLNLARRTHDAGNLAELPVRHSGSGRSTEGCRRRRSPKARLCKVCVIEDIEKRRPELDIQRFPNLSVLQHRQVGTEKMRADRDIPPQTAQRALRL